MTATLEFRITDRYVDEVVAVEFGGCFDDTVGPVSLAISQVLGAEAKPDEIPWEISLEFNATQIRALRTFLDMALSFPHLDDRRPYQFAAKQAGVHREARTDDLIAERLEAKRNAE